MDALNPVFGRLENMIISDATTLNRVADRALPAQYSATPGSDGV